VNRDLFLAILSMDSYNRGYGVSVKGLLESGSIGNATLAPATTEQKEGWLEAGFYAIAYDVSGIAGIPGGTRVVMYRGSDSFISGNTPGEGGDVLNGYGGAAGDVYSPQALLALKFTNNATGRAVTGHMPGTVH
jgi:hypothetical protein